MLTNSVLGRGKGPWHLNAIQDGKPIVVNHKPLRELLKMCPDNTFVYDGFRVLKKTWHTAMIYGPVFDSENPQPFLNALKQIPNISIGVVKGGRIVGKMIADYVHYEFNHDCWVEVIQLEKERDLFYREHGITPEKWLVLFGCFEHSSANAETSRYAKLIEKEVLISGQENVRLVEPANYSGRQT
jgi:hypothetical protein